MKKSRILVLGSGVLFLFSALAIASVAEREQTAELAKLPPGVQEAINQHVGAGKTEEFLASAFGGILKAEEEENESEGREAKAEKGEKEEGEAKAAKGERKEGLEHKKGAKAEKEENESEGREAKAEKGEKEEGEAKAAKGERKEGLEHKKGAKAEEEENESEEREGKAEKGEKEEGEAKAEKGERKEGLEHKKGAKAEGKEEKEEAEREEAIDLAKAPKPVQQAVKKALAGNPLKKLVKEAEEEGQAVYEAEWEVKGAQHSVEVAANGEIMEMEHSIAEKDLPAAALAALKKEYPGAKIAAVDAVQSFYYEVQIVAGGKEKEVKINAAADIEDDEGEEADED